MKSYTVEVDLTLTVKGEMTVQANREKDAEDLVKERVIEDPLAFLANGDLTCPSDPDVEVMQVEQFTGA